MEPKNTFRLSDYDVIDVVTDDDELIVSIDESSDTPIIVHNEVKVLLRKKNGDIEEYR